MKFMLQITLALFGTLFFVACDEGPLEEAGENVDEAFEDVGDAVEDVADDVEDAVDDGK